MQQKVESGNLSFGHARTLLSLESPDAILKAAQKVSALSMSVRQTESYVQGLLNPEKKPRVKKKKRLRSIPTFARRGIYCSEP